MFAYHVPKLDPQKDAAETAAKLYDLFGDQALSLAVDQLEQADDAERPAWREIVKLLLAREAGAAGE